MLFNSFPFLFFYAIVFAAYFLIPGKWRWTVLLAASVYFYMAFIPVYILIIGFIIAIDYFAALAIQKTVAGKRRNMYYYTALICNLGVLVFFKYFNFLNENLSSLLSVAHIKNPVNFIKLALPLGISFSTFQSVGYLIDVKNGKINAERHLGVYAVFIMFFPHISSGPIARSGHLLPQLHKTNTLNATDFSVGFSQVMLGLFKKVVVGDMLGNYVDTFFRSYEQYSGFAYLFACWIFLFQLYADFSGYSDIATGIARMLGYRLNINFALPLFSKTMTELWRRWHISLSTWLRDYLYTPMYIAKRHWGKFAVVFSQMVTFAICGLWHGAGWQFLIYGLIHGFYLVTEYLLNIKSSFYNKSFLRKCLGVFITFNLLSLSLILFRSPDFAHVQLILSNIFTHLLPLKVTIYDSAFFITMLSMLAVLMLIEYIFLRNDSFDTLYLNKKKTLFSLNLVIVMLIVLFGISSNTQFIYFQF